MGTGLTRGQIRSEVRTYLLNVDVAQQGWTDAELNKYMDEGAFYIQQLTASLWDYAVIPVVANQADYTLPDNSYQLIRSCFDRQFLPQTTEYELDRDTSSAWRGDPTGTPCRFYLKQFNVASLYQVPRTTGNSYFPGGITNVIASDSFNRANENPLNPALWTVATNPPIGNWAHIQIVSNAAQSAMDGSGGEKEGVELLCNTFPVDQYAEFKVIALTNGAAAGIILRADVTTWFSYEMFVSDDGGGLCEIEIDLWNGVGLPPVVLFKSSPFPFVSGDTYRFVILGSLLAAFRNGVLVGSAVDTTHTLAGFTALDLLPNSSSNEVRVTNFAEGATSNIGEVQNFTLPDNVTLDTSFSFSSEFGVVTQLINTSGSSMNRFEPDPQNRFSNPDYGLVIAFADETQNLSFMFVAQTDTMTDDSQSPQFQETFHPAMVYYTLMRCFARDGEFQDIEVATAWYQAFLDWMDSALQADAKEFPTMVKSAEPYGIGNVLNGRLQAVGPPSQLIVIGTP